ncbi:uncharacterized protein EAF02_011717 [Botrytis sinoallii]|uniref:uncharacterized protein n=1 Tax=Botrytis sinoallii TaxID=1463999 RepID=UPI001901107D|nr:uncharacterized protein EAF02_011717 [Botrytis sinoallii]KAF7854099.1 hypothetical protein EAF02_011717 [Botrytis sinoallii]
MTPSNLKHIPRSLSKRSSSISRAISVSLSISPSTSTFSRTNSRRPFASTASKKDQNRIYSAVRYPHDLATYISLSTSSSKPLLTLWTTSYCSTCKTISPLLQQILEAGVGEQEGGVLFAEVEYDAPDVMSEGLGVRYMVRSVPRSSGVWRGEVMGGEGERLGSREIQDLGREGLEEWVRGAARRGREWREGIRGRGTFWGGCGRVGGNEGGCLFCFLCINRWFGIRFVVIYIFISDIPISYHIIKSNGSKIQIQYIYIHSINRSI